MTAISTYRRRLSATASAVAVMLCAAIVGGCSGPPHKDWAALLNTDRQSDAPKGNKPKGQPKLEIGGQTLGEGHEVSLTSEQLKSRLQELLTAQRPAWAAHWVERHPDAALELLRSCCGAEPDAAINFIAATHDRQCVVKGSQTTWKKLLASSQGHPGPVAKYGAARKQFKDTLQGGHADKALAMNLPKLATDAGSPLLEIDALQLTGTAQLLGDRPALAVETFIRAIASADHVSTYQQTYLLLLLSDAQRRAGDAPHASETWQRAVVLAGRMIASDHAVLDPVLWERLSYLRPVEMQWPDGVLQTLAQQFPLPGLDSNDGADPNHKAALAEAVIWNAIGRWYIDRNHAQPALVAFKRAEAAVGDPLAQQWLRICEANALVFLDQIGPATAVLVPLAADSDSTMSRPAMGLLGSLRLKSGQVSQGLTLLKRAVEEDESADWPNHAQSLADLGLGYLMVGEEQLGLRRLHDAQHLFEIAGEEDSLVLALENEAAYLENTKRRKDAEQIRRRVKEIEQANQS